MTRPTWIRRALKAGTSHRAATRRPRLRLDPLEGRDVPAAGMLDPTFGNGGIVTTDFGIPSNDFGASVVQADGKVVVAGYSFEAGTGLDFAVARYNADGSLDASFGIGGRVLIDFGSA